MPFKISIDLCHNYEACSETPVRLACFCDAQWSLLDAVQHCTFHGDASSRLLRRVQITRFVGFYISSRLWNVFMNLKSDLSGSGFGIQFKLCCGAPCTVPQCYLCERLYDNIWPNRHFILAYSPLLYSEWWYTDSREWYNFHKSDWSQCDKILLKYCWELQKKAFFFFCLVEHLT